MTADLVPEGPAGTTPGIQPLPLAPKWTEELVLQALWRHFTTAGWAAVTQVTVAPHDLDGAQPGASAGLRRPGVAKDRRIDLLAFRRPRNRHRGDLETLAVEVKVTRSDFASDIKDPDKQAVWRAAATRHAYATPAGLVAPEEVPEGSGLLYVGRGWGGYGDATWARKAPYILGHTPTLPTRPLLALIHRLAAIEARTHGWAEGEHPTTDGPADAAAVIAAHKVADRANRDASKAAGERDAWKRAYAMLAAGGHPCRWCGEPVKPLRPDARRGWFASWRHVDRAHDAACAEAETEHLYADAAREYLADTPEARARRLASARRLGASPWLDSDPVHAYLPSWLGEVQLTGPEPEGGLPDLQP